MTSIWIALALGPPLALALSQSPGETAIAPYLSLEPERSWSYRGSEPTPSVTVSLEREGDWLVHTTGARASVVRLDPEDGYLLRARETEEGSFEYERPVVLLPPVLKRGEVHRSQRRFVRRVGGEKRDVGAHYFEAELIGIEAVTTPAGRFEKCLRVRRHETRMDFSGTAYVYDGVDWYAAGVGLVRSEGEHLWKDAEGSTTSARATKLELAP